MAFYIKCSCLSPCLLTFTDNMRLRASTLVEFVVHSILWIALTALFIHFNALSFHYLKGDLMDIPLIFGTLINVSLFYLNLLYLFPRYKSKDLGLLKYSVWILAAVIISSALENTFDYFYAVSNIADTKVSLQVGEIAIVSLINLFFILLSVLYSIIKDWITIEIIKRKLTEENLRLELDFLKSQVSPHFLFNSLNNLYSIALKNNDNETASGLTKLSTLMRFMLDKTDKTAVKIDEEIAYLKSYIEMQKLRFLDSDNIEISFTVKGEANTIKVPPFLLINLIENAFKHGIDYRKASKIDIIISLKKDMLFFKIVNTNNADAFNEKDSKLGLKNVKKRLDLIYSGDYTLDINYDNQLYMVELTIKSL